MSLVTNLLETAIIHRALCYSVSHLSILSVPVGALHRIIAEWKSECCFMSNCPKEECNQCESLEKGCVKTGSFMPKGASYITPKSKSWP